MMCEGKIQHNSYYQECLFYLHSYGTNLAIISFYMRHDCMREALLHLLNKVSNSIFITKTEIWKTAMGIMQRLGGFLRVCWAPQMLLCKPFSDWQECKETE